MAEDAAILHITDLHFPPSGEEPEWKGAFLASLGRLSTEQGLRVVGVAVTGDLVDTPNRISFRAAKKFLGEVLEALNLREDGRLSWSRMWVVDGNHDYRFWGLMRGSRRGEFSDGIQSGKIDRLAEIFTDDRLLVAGFDSGKEGALARGRISVEQLRTFDDRIRRIESEQPEGRGLRIALMHHHLLPFPPTSPDLGDRSIKDIINEEGLKLLGNAGLVTSVLVQNDFDLVIHGHEHERFIARVQHIRNSNFETPLTVVGGPNLKSGFQLVVARDSGDIELRPYERADAGIYARGTSVTLVTYEEWKERVWRRRSRTLGSCSTVRSAMELLSDGNFEEETLVGGLRAADEREIQSYRFSRVTPPDLGSVRLDLVEDLEAQSLIGPLPNPGANIAINLPLNPPARADRTHKGFRAQFTGVNALAVTDVDLALFEKERERFSSGVVYPTRRIESVLTFPVFPRPLAPESVSLDVYTVRESGDFVADPAEQHRAQKGFRYDRERGIAILQLDFVSPEHKYELTWIPPELDVDLSWGGKQRYDAVGHYDRLCRLDPADTESRANQVLANGRDALVRSGFGDAGTRIEALQLGMFLFDTEASRTRAVAGTFAPDSAQWGADLRWGVGMLGSAMRRGRPLLYARKVGAPSAVYVRAEGGVPDEFYVAVPLALPPRAEIPDHPPPGFFRCAIAASSISRSSGLLCAEEDAAQFHRLAGLLAAIGEEAIRCLAE